MAAPLRDLCARLPKAAPLRDLGARLLKVSAVRPRFLSSYQKQARHEWSNLDPRSKVTLLEMVGKWIMFGMSGGWGVMLAKHILDHVKKAEMVVEDLSNTVDELKAEVYDSKEEYRNHRAELEARYEKLETKYEKLHLEVKDLRSGPLVRTWVQEPNSVRGAPGGMEG